MTGATSGFDGDAADAAAQIIWQAWQRGEVIAALPDEWRL